MTRNRYVRLFLTAIVLFLVLQRGYVHLREAKEHFLIDVLNGGPSATIINLITPQCDVTVANGRLIGRLATTDIRKGCEGFEVMILLVAFMAISPISWRRRVAGIGLGCLLIYVLNIVRIVSLYYIVWRAPRLFDTFHIGVWQVGIIVPAWLFFMFWTRPSIEPQNHPAPTGTPTEQLDADG